MDFSVGKSAKSATEEDHGQASGISSSAIQASKLIWLELVLL